MVIVSGGFLHEDMNDFSRMAAIAARGHITVYALHIDSGLASAEQSRITILITGIDKTTAGYTLELSKQFKTSTVKIIGTDGAAGPAETFDDAVRTTMRVAPNGEFEWHVNPSTRPEVIGGRARTSD